MRVPFSLHLCHHLLLSEFLLKNKILGSLKSNFIPGLIVNFQMVKNLSIFYILISNSHILFGEMSIQIFTPCLLGLSVFLVLSSKIPYIFWIYILYQIHDLKIFLTQDVSCLYIFLTVSF